MIMNAITSTRLGRLSNHYGDVGGRPAGERFYDAFQRYLKANRESLFDLTLAAASAEVFLDRGIDDIDPRLVDAIRVTNPSLSDEHLFGLSDEELQGAVNTAKGKYFEYLVADRLNAGEQVGPVLLPDGYQAVLADSLNQPGWDMRIVGPDGVSSITFSFCQSNETFFSVSFRLRIQNAQLLFSSGLNQYSTFSFAEYLKPWIPSLS